jgi:multicomponent Na+:H+ antiporter subunit A
VGAVTLFWGSFMAIRQVDLKAMLAYSTISQLGIMMCLLGIGSMALNPTISEEQALLFSGAILASIFHLVNHSIFKGSLFMVVGILDHELGTRDIRKLGGLMSFMPVSFTLTLVGAFSMAGLPPFSGFLSKELFFTGVLTAFRETDSWLILLPIAAWIASVFTFIYCMILVFKTFTGPFKPAALDKTPHEAPIGMLLPPMVLGAAVVVLFFIPNWLASTILEPSMRATLPGLLAPGERFDVHISIWHGFKMELVMTIGIVIIGSLLYLRLSRVLDVYEFLPRKFTLNRAFDQLLTGFERLSEVVTNKYMTGSVRDYLVYIFSFLVVVVGGGLLLQQAVSFDFTDNATIYLYEYVLGFSIVAASICILFSKSRLTSIIALSAIGFLVALLFVNFRAPDLALTQFVVETISTSLFLLCFYFLPKLRKDVSTMPFRLTNMMVALGVGVTLTLIGLSVQGKRVFEPISSFYENAYELSGAKNIVNAILVDFRGFDTMLEIVVLFSAGIGVYTLIKLRQAKGDES